MIGRLLIRMGDALQRAGRRRESRARRLEVPADLEWVLLRDQGVLVVPPRPVRPVDDPRMHHPNLFTDPKDRP